jgi:Flp pilus assembly protein TadD
LDIRGEAEPENAESWLTLAKRFLRDKKFGEADEAFRKACSHNPNNKSIWISYAAFLLSQGRETDAEKAGKKAIELMDEKKSWSRLRSELRKQNRESKEGIIIETPITIIPSEKEQREEIHSQKVEPENDEEIGDVAYKRFELVQTTVGTSEPSIKIEPKQDEVTEELGTFLKTTCSEWFTQAQYHLKTGQYSEAENYARKGLRNEPESGDGWYLLGLALFNQEKIAAARKAFTRSVRRIETNQDSWIHLGRCYLKENRYEESCKALLKAIDLDTDNSFTWYILGVVYIRMNRTRDAIIALTKSTQLDHLNAEAWNQLCVAHRLRGNYEQAILAAKRAVQIDPEWAGAWGNLAHCLTSLGRLSEAEQAKRKLQVLRAKESK